MKSQQHCPVYLYEFFFGNILDKVNIHTSAGFHLYLYEIQTKANLDCNGGSTGWSVLKLLDWKTSMTKLDWLCVLSNLVSSQCTLWKFVLKIELNIIHAKQMNISNGIQKISSTGAWMSLIAVYFHCQYDRSIASVQVRSGALRQHWCAADQQSNFSKCNIFYARFILTHSKCRVINENRNTSCLLNQIVNEVHADWGKINRKANIWCDWILLKLAMFGAINLLVSFLSPTICNCVHCDFRWHALLWLNMHAVLHVRYLSTSLGSIDTTILIQLNGVRLWIRIVRRRWMITTAVCIKFNMIEWM